MESNQDFIIENGVLEKYTGPGGDIAIPARPIWSRKAWMERDAFLILPTTRIFMM